MKYIIFSAILLSLMTLTPKPLKHVDIDLSKPPPKPTFIPLGPNISEEEIILSRYTVEQKVGQLFIYGFDGTNLNEQNKQFLVNNNIGGVLLLGKNIGNEKQLKNLISEIQNANEIPLFISIDQEGDPVSRIKWDDGITKSQTKIATPEESYEDAITKGTYLKEIGINMNLAPVIEYVTDTHSFIYNRTFRGSRVDVLQKSISAIDGYGETGIISVPKHYPGHSDTSTDSHDALPVVDIKESEWYEYIKPFSQVLNQTKVDALMVGHVKFPNIDKNPTTISNEIINNKLIKELQYDGLVISDDMEMGALDNIGTYQENAKKALEAGIDILIYSKYSSKDPQIQRDVYDFILQEVKNGNLNIDEKFLKILRIKMKYRLFD
jgi:beta-N-acetylhexosaminidase